MAQIPDADLNAAKASLNTLSDDELKDLIGNDSIFDNFVKQLPQVKKWESDKEILIASNKSLAEYNLSFEPKLTEGKRELVDLYEQARSVIDELETKRGQLESLNSRTSLDTSYVLLQAASAEAEEKSESLTEEFIGGDMTMDSFIEQYIPQRVTAHLRRLKAEKMGEIANSQRNRSSFSGVPYPTNAAQMPMPTLPPKIPPRKNRPAPPLPNTRK